MGLSLRTRRDNARGIGKRDAKAWRSRRYVSTGIGNRAVLATGTGNAGYEVYSEVPGTAGNSITFAVVVAGANTAESVTATGTALTYNAATNGASAATSTVRGMVEAVNRYSHAEGAVVKLHAQRPRTSDGTSVIAALTATALAGAV